MIISNYIANDKIMYFSKLIPQSSSTFNQECSDSCQCQDENHASSNDPHDSLKALHKKSNFLLQM